MGNGLRRPPPLSRLRWVWPCLDSATAARRLARRLFKVVLQGIRPPHSRRSSLLLPLSRTPFPTDPRPTASPRRTACQRRRHLGIRHWPGRVKSFHPRARRGSICAPQFTLPPRNGASISKATDPCPRGAELASKCGALLFCTVLCTGMQYIFLASTPSPTGPLAGVVCAAGPHDFSILLWPGASFSICIRVSKQQMGPPPAPRHWSGSVADSTWTVRRPCSLSVQPRP
jgi:hypothetical protein